MKVQNCSIQICFFHLSLSSYRSTNERLLFSIFWLRMSHTRSHIPYYTPPSPYKVQCLGNLYRKRTKYKQYLPSSLSTPSPSPRMHIASASESIIILFPFCYQFLSNINIEKLLTYFFFLFGNGFLASLFVVL